jgi:hypothetical protein
LFLFLPAGILSLYIRELDGMPSATVSYTNEAPEHNYRIGFPLGFKKVLEFYIFAKKPFNNILRQIQLLSITT